MQSGESLGSWKRLLALLLVERRLVVSEAGLGQEEGCFLAERTTARGMRWRLVVLESLWRTLEMRPSFASSACMMGGLLPRSRPCFSVFWTCLGSWTASGRYAVGCFPSVFLVDAIHWSCFGVYPPPRGGGVPPCTSGVPIPNGDRQYYSLVWNKPFLESPDRWYKAQGGLVRRKRLKTKNGHLGGKLENGCL